VPRTTRRIAASSPAPTSADPDADSDLWRNEVVLVGRLSAEPVERELPSGDRVTSFRIVVRRPTDVRRPGRAVDALDCAVWRAELRRSVSRWAVGDLVEVSGAVHRRFWRGAAGPASAWEVEVSRVRRVARA
jgi:single-strand DNA-binding protein